MSGCSLQASGLTSIVGGQAPTFSYHRTGHSNDYFGVAMTYVNGANKCFGYKPPFTPVLVNPTAGFTKPCMFEYHLFRGYTGIYCYDVPVTNVPDGVLTISHSNYVGPAASTPALFYATFGSSPAAKTSTVAAAPVTSTITLPTTVAIQPAVTTTIQIPYTTVTQTNTIVVTSSAISKHINTITNCIGQNGYPASMVSASSASAASQSAALQSAASAASQSAAAVASQIAASASQASAASASSAFAALQSAASQSAAAASQSAASVASQLAASASQALASQALASQASAALQSAASQSSAAAALTSATVSSLATPPSASLTSTSSIVASTSSPSTVLTPVTCPGDNGKQIATSAGTFMITCGVDRAGASLGGARYPGGGFQGCIDLCANTPGCVDLSYTGEACYLKSDKGIVSNPNPDVYAAYLISRSSSAVSSGPAATVSSSVGTASISTSASPSAPTYSSADISCPGSNGQIISTSAGNFVIECYQDRFDNDIGVAASHPSNYAQCIQACAAYNGCQAVSYIPNGTCYLKGGLGQARKNYDVWGASLQSEAGSYSASSTSSQAASLSAPSATASSSITASVQTVMVTTTLSGTGYKCACTPTGGLASSTVTPGFPSSYDISVTCPNGNGMIYISECGAIYEIECSADRYGNDLQNGLVYTDTFKDCIKACDNNPGCIDVSWVNEYGRSSCYMKGSIGPIRKNSNIWGARQITACTKPYQLKLHRKRVVRPERPNNVQKRGLAIGPDYTHIATITAVTVIPTSVVTVLSTVTPVIPGTITKTVPYAAFTTAIVTNTAVTTVVQQAYSTICPQLTNPFLYPLPFPLPF